MKRFPSGPDAAAVVLIWMESLICLSHAQMKMQKPLKKGTQDGIPVSWCLAGVCTCVMGVVLSKGFTFGHDNNIKVGEESMVYSLNQHNKSEDKSEAKSEDTSPSPQPMYSFIRYIISLKCSRWNSSVVDKVWIWYLNESLVAKIKKIRSQVAKTNDKDWMFPVFHWAPMVTNLLFWWHLRWPFLSLAKTMNDSSGRSYQLSVINVDFVTNLFSRCFLIIHEVKESIITVNSAGFSQQKL